MKVKICGITTETAAKTAVEAGADMIGFVFAKSIRQISPEKAAAISKTLPPSVKKVGVFVNETAERISEISIAAGLDYVQLHGEESPEFCRNIPFPVIKAVSIRTREDVESAAVYTCEFLLVDSPGGGTGVPFDWTLLDELGVPKTRLLLAGGLSADNVCEAIRVVDPAGVDVSSGVETDGEKDDEKIRLFIKEAKSGGVYEG